MARDHAARCLSGRGGALSARAVAAERNARRRREQVVQDQQLNQGKRFRTMEVRADRELAEPLRTEMACEVQSVPDHLFDRASSLAFETARDAKMCLAVDLADPDPVARIDFAVQYRAKVRVTERGP